MRRLLRPLAVSLPLLVAIVYVNNTSLLAKRPSGPPTVLAHRGIARQVETTDLRNDTCTASRMLPPTHNYLENTIPSMQASFEAGADIVEVDVHPTTDGQFAVFHDWTLDCRTNGSGVSRGALDGCTQETPHRLWLHGGWREHLSVPGQGIGLMPSLEDVLATCPTRRFMINVKSRDRTEGERLAADLLLVTRS